MKTKNNQIRKIEDLHLWEKNPRSIKEKDFFRLKKQIETLGVYKPLIITEDGTVLGGNMRLRAYQELGIKEVWVSIVEAPTEEKKLEYALSDNDRAGFYDSDLLANLTGEMPNFNWGDYSIDLYNSTNIQDLIDSYNFDPKKEWKDMPEFKQEGTDFYKMLTVRFLTKEDYEKFAKLIDQNLTEKTGDIWFPKQDFDSQGRDLVFTKDA